MAQTKSTEENSAAPGRPGRKRTKPFDYARSRQAFRRVSDFAAYLAGYPDFSAVLGYWYRLRPKIDLGRIGIRDSHIHKTSDPAEMTEEFCASKWGRGLYMLRFTDANRPNGEQEACKAWFTIDDPDLTPIYDPRTLLVHDPDNADEVARLVALGVLVRDGDTGAPRVKTESAAAPAAPVAPAPAAPVAAAIAPAPAPVVADSITNQIVLKLLERALPSATPPTPSEVLEQSFRIAERFQPSPAAAPSLDQIADAVALRLRPAAAAPAAPSIASELETYERVGALLDKVGAGRATVAESAGSSGGWSIVAGLMDSMLKPLLPLAVAFLSRNAGAPAGAVAPSAVPGPSGSGAAPSALPAPSLPEFLPPDAPIMDRAVQVVSLALQKLDEGVEGYRVASWLCNWYPGGKDIYRMLEGNGGAVGCMGLMSMLPMPDLRARLADPQRAALVEAFLQDFFTYDSEAMETTAEAVSEVDGAAA